MTNTVNLIYGFDIFGTIIFALTGALKGIEKDLDFLGVIVFATTVGCGGGMIRDSLIGATPAAALTNYIYLVVCVIVGILVFFVGSLIHSERKIIKYADAIGLGVFTALGCAKGALYECSAMGQVLCGVVTATGGGVIRDIMSKNIPTILTSDFYATASLLGGFLYLTLERSSLSVAYLFLICSVFVFIIRVVAINMSFELPRSSSFWKKRNK
ncbi:MAG: trimeric intracellular cation channel family protein [Sphaerochaetaceae bacterium]|nr:trimeric intracellular cation channel family protein [Sphaerochaetaceae bacterium]MDC7237457.1 trimeric intracellular cation channel family protein [Sphaerochaetaceae bacterium]MDC7242997.1 trimeric intracellular cation channel family protein [Sphaerochaetaceae bacterium]MDC7248555.1 trimeric intracellular cation channel family protein [Sphaerochaetaceae bacterium]